MRKGKGNPDAPAKVHYTKADGTRETKLAWLNGIERFDEVEWLDCSSEWRVPFLPTGRGDYFAWPAVTDVFLWQSNGVQFKRTWPIAPTRDTLERRWRALMSKRPTDRADLFIETPDRTIGRTYDNGLPGSRQPSIYSLGPESQPQIIDYGYRSFGRAHAIFDVRLADRPRPDLFFAHSDRQVYLTSLLAFAIGEGPAATTTHLLPDLHHY